MSVLIAEPARAAPPSRALGDDRRPAWRGWCRVAWPRLRAQLRVGQRACGPPPGTTASPRRCADAARAPSACRGRSLMRPLASVAARISARCTVRGAGAQPGQAAADVHQARRVAGRSTTSAPVARTLRILSASIAVEVSAFFSANVPPKPQHWSARGSSTRSMPAHRPQQPQRLVADPQHPQRVAGRVVGDPVRVVRADVGRRRARRPGTPTARRCGAATRLGPRGQAVVPGPRGRPSRAGAAPSPTHDPDGATDRRRSRLEDLDVVADQRHAPRAGSRC